MQHKFRRVLNAGETLFREGDVGDEAYVIESGSVEIRAKLPAGEKILAQLGADDILGEMALVGDQRRTASATALENTTLAVITQEYLAERLNQADPMLRHLLRVTTTRYRDTLLRSHGTPDAPATDSEASPGLDRQLALQRLRTEHDIERALEAGEFRLYYQPIVRLADGSIAGFEALIRWEKPGVGLIPPVDFIGIAEESGLIVQMGHWIIRTACADITRLEATQHGVQANMPPLFITINLSIRQFSDPQLFDTIREALTAQQLAAHRIKLEVTESMVMSNVDAALELIKQCKSLGTQLAVDDFGTGYSSLAYLHRFPMDTIKLDRSFIRDMPQNPSSMKIVRAMAQLASELNMDTVCEGVETADQAETCRGIGITYAQGFHYSPAVPVERAVQFLLAHSRSSK